MNIHNSPMNKSTFPLDTLTQYEVAKGQHCGKTSELLIKDNMLYC
jgi:hypothetical protein